MTKKTTRNEHYSDNEPVLFLSFELGISEWKLAMSTGLGQKARRRCIPARDLERLAAEVAAGKKRFGLPGSAPVVSCYEAGRDGFWLHRSLRTSGIENHVVDSSSIEVNRRARRAKSDGLDVEKLLNMLIRYQHGDRKVWSVVHVPSAEEEDRRHLHRELQTVKRERARTTNRIKGLLATQGIRLQGRLQLSGGELDAIRLWDGSPLPAALKGRLKRQWEHVLFLTGQIRELESERRRAWSRSEEPDIGKVRQLAQLRGIGINGAWVTVREFFGWRKLKNRREVGALSGLAPTPYQSSAVSREQGISKAGNRHVRAMMIELAWCWLRYQPRSRLTLWYKKRFAGGGIRARKVGIVALARRLLIELWKFLETGAVPEGAELKKTA